MLEFLVDENGLREDLLARPSLEDLAVLQETFFVFPTRFTINGSQMFGSSKNRLVLYGGHTGSELDSKEQEIENYWLPLPLLHTAWVGFEQVRKACAGEETAYSLPGTGEKLIFVPAQDKLEVRSTLGGKVEWVECQELIEAFNNFNHKVVSFIRNSVPDMEHHPDWPKVIKVTSYER